MDLPEAPISHHWLDSTHITFGVLTGGIVLDRVKLEVSRFNGREPDQHRWNIETGPLDSTAVRAILEPDAGTVAAGQLGPFQRSRAARARGRPEALVGQRALRARDCAGMEACRHACLGTEDRRASQRRRLCRRSIAQAERLDPLRPRRDHREPRTARGRGSRPGLSGSASSRWAASATSASPTTCRSVPADCSRSTSCPMGWRRSTAAASDRRDGLPAAEARLID